MDRYYQTPIELQEEIEANLEAKIKKLKRQIKYRQSDGWQRKERKNAGLSDTNGYFWNHLGEAEEWFGKLEGMECDGEKCLCW